MSRIPSDRQVLQAIYDKYVDQYPGSTEPSAPGENDPYMPIDINSIASKLCMKPELLFGRLYYHLDKVHRYEQDSGAKVHLFHLNLQNLGHSVNFSYLASILAGHREQHWRTTLPIALSITAILISIATAVANYISIGSQ